MRHLSRIRWYFANVGKVSCEHEHWVVQCHRRTEIGTETRADRGPQAGSPVGVVDSSGIRIHLTRNARKDNWLFELESLTRSLSLPVLTPLRHRLLLDAREILAGALFQPSTFRNAAALPESFTL